jgi:hypothetical protein
MAITAIRGKQVLDGSIQRADLDTSTTGQAVVAKLVQGSNITLSSTGADSGTGDVTISAPPGTPGANAFTVTAIGSFTVPTTGNSTTVNVADASWIGVGQLLSFENAGGSGLAGILQVTVKTGNQLTVLNPY